MTDERPYSNDVLAEAPPWLARLGVRSWLITGVLLVGGIGAWLLAKSSTIVVPLLLAIILGVLFAPLVTTLERLHIPRAAAAWLTMLLILATGVGVIWTIVASVGGQISVISSQVVAGLARLQAWLVSLRISQTAVDAITKSIEAQLPKLGTSVANALFSGLTGIAGIAFGAFISLYMLFYTLNDSEKLADWAGRHLGLPHELGHAIVEDSGDSIRQYFQGTAVLALITSLATGVGLAVVGVPLVIPIAVVTFVLTFIPYFGAIVSCAFAILIALGAGGVKMALLAALVVLIAQNIIQGAIVGWAIGGALNLHPIVVICATMVGGIFGGLIGGMLGAPLVAILVRLVTRLRAASEALASPGGPPEPTAAENYPSTGVVLGGS